MSLTLHSPSFGPSDTRSHPGVLDFSFPPVDEITTGITKLAHTDRALDVERALMSVEPEDVFSTQEELLGVLKTAAAIRKEQIAVSIPSGYTTGLLETILEKPTTFNPAEKFIAAMALLDLRKEGRTHDAPAAKYPTFRPGASVARVVGKIKETDADRAAARKTSNFTTASSATVAPDPAESRPLGYL